MASKSDDGRSARELRFELKYCERCGGLHLRPVGGEQVYCAACSRHIAELPPASHEVGRATMQRGPRWGADHCDYEGEIEDEALELDPAGGAV
jgi:hypothetical protein